MSPSDADPDLEPEPQHEADDGIREEGEGHRQDIEKEDEIEGDLSPSRGAYRPVRRKFQADSIHKPDQESSSLPLIPSCAHSMWDRICSCCRFRLPSGFPFHLILL